jgi:hypothetical protein
MGVPKTIDNDLWGTDHCPGYGSAAKYIATSTMEVYHDARVYDKGMVTILEIMGRNAGWLTAASALAAYKGFGPDLIYLPELPFDMDKFLEDAAAIYKKNGNCIVAVSEGTPVFLNIQFVTNDAYMENGEIYVYYLAAEDYFGLDSEAAASMDLKISEKNGRIYINMTDAASKMGGKLQYDKANNNIYFIGNIIKINGAFLSSYNGGFDKEYSFSRALLQGIDTDIMPVSNVKQAVNLKDYTKEKSWELNVDSLYKTINIDIPLRIKAGDKYLSTAFWNNRYFLKYEDAAFIPGIENQSINLYEYNYVKYIDIYELMQVFEYKKDSFFTVIEFIKPIENKNTVR